MDNHDARTTLVVGATGISGAAICRAARARGSQVLGVSRREPTVPGVQHVAADLLDDASVRGALEPLRPSTVHLTAWVRRDTEAENIETNSAVVRRILDALGPAGSVGHVALMTGLKHYLGPFEAYAQGKTPDTPFHEDEPRLDLPNFYYAQEDVLFEAAARYGFTWSVHRSHTVIGHAVGNAMNMALTIAVAASIARETGRPLVFPGSAAQWNGLTDVTDADVLADQMLWAASTPAAADQAFNIVNGDVFRWRWMWPRIAGWFGVEWEGWSGEDRPFQTRMAEAAGVWRDVASRHGLVEQDVERLASWWHTDSDLGRPMEVVTDMARSRAAGFTTYRSSWDSFRTQFERYRAERLIP
ncbi:SDR family oxidoreductase [Kineococcus rhizosphaerae]|uniref:Nucleoside-diphosphate-sugar epimerase n=1 Tax=Kineococcus rhizosphaerae TaxID=559628 RepID=A0A2T0QXB7_9ACTN|nr:SDR family oxidoreductase [Kineococcus rhizosphaerae]PRY10522.1 nucleoside-diphosphate-sugar epimerase [Kineococcus rhizosphaerae]